MADVWHLLRTEDGRAYYYNRVKRITQWEKPEGYVIDIEKEARAAAEGSAAGDGDGMMRNSVSSAPSTPPGGSSAKEKDSSFSEMLRKAGERIKNHPAILRRNESEEKEGRQRAKSTSANAEGCDSFAMSPLPKTRRKSDASGAVNELANESARSSLKDLSEEGSSFDSQESAHRHNEVLDDKDEAKGTRSMDRKSSENRRYRRIWEKKKTATVGLAGTSEDEAQIYYLNIETGETQWERPEKYLSDDEVERMEETSEIEFDKEASPMQILEELGFLSEISVQDREQMLDSGEDDGGRCEFRLRQLYLALKYAGSPEEWVDCIQQGDYELVLNIYKHLGQADRTPRGVRAVTCILLETFLKIDSSLIRRYTDDDWGLDTVEFLRNIEKGLHECSEDEGAFFSWLSLLYNFLTEIPRLASDALPSEDTIEILISCMDAKDEDVFLLAAYVIVALNSHHGHTAEQGTAARVLEAGDEDMSATLDDHPNQVVQILQKDAHKVELFGEAILHLLNTSSYPYDDPVLLGQLLYMFRSLFSTRATREFFYTNDLKVLVDIILHQLSALSPDDEFRVDFLRLLHLVIINSPWTKSHYRRVDILESLDAILAASESGMLQLSCKCALRILLDCVVQLS